jgi:hypothetical protein
MDVPGKKSGPTQDVPDLLSAQQWTNLLERDIEAIRLAKLNAPVLLKRLEEAAARKDNGGHWYRFSSNGGGISNQTVQCGKRVITVQFAAGDYGYNVYLILKGVSERYRAALELIKNVSYQNLAQPKGHFALYIEIVEPEPEPTPQT